MTLNELIPLLTAPGLAALQYALVEANPQHPSALDRSLLKAHLDIERTADALIGADEFQSLVNAVFTAVDEIQY